MPASSRSPRLPKNQVPAIRNVVFDVGNVLIRFQPRPFLLACRDAPACVDRVLDRLTRSTLWRRLDLGELDMATAERQFRACIREQVPGGEPFVDYFFQHWRELLTPIPGPVALLGRLRAGGCRVYLLSNVVREVWEYLEATHAFLREVDGQLLSYRVHRVKPDPRIFALLLETFALDPQETVFVDDQPANVAAARAAGLVALPYQPPDTDLEALLRARGVPGS